MTNRTDDRASQTVLYQVTGMDCTSCATKIEGAARKIDGVEDVKVSIASQVMTLRLAHASARLPEVERVVTGLGYRLLRLDDTVPNAASGTTGMESSNPTAHLTAAYRRALWIVILLNVGYGLVEITAGVLARSQSLRADALDFIGDGLISFLGLLALGWSPGWRARSAMVQGLFLGSLGLGVLGVTIYRTVIINQPSAELMGIFGAIALVVNVSAAVVLIPHRAGDSNMRAVWLFSRNDAIGNLAVVAAAGLVAWTRTPWPDLVVAAIVAGLFLHSARSIVTDARSDLRTQGGRRT